MYNSNAALASVSPINGPSQRVLPAVLRPKTLSICDYWLLVRDPEEHHMYVTMPREVC